MTHLEMIEEQIEHYRSLNENPGSKGWFTKEVADWEDLRDTYIELKESLLESTRLLAKLVCTNQEDSALHDRIDNNHRLCADRMRIYVEEPL